MIHDFLLGGSLALPNSDVPQALGLPIWQSQLRCKSCVSKPLCRECGKPLLAAPLAGSRIARRFPERRPLMAVPPCEAIDHESIVVETLIVAARTTRGHAFRTPSGSPCLAQPSGVCEASVASVV
jgi:hypothetical protein